MLKIINVYLHMTYKESIKKIGLTFNHVAGLLDISNVTLSYYLNNVRPIPEDVEKELKSIIERYSNI